MAGVLRSRSIKSPKIYYADTGLLCSLLGLRENTIDHYAHIGPIWETYLYSEFRKRRTNQGLGFSTWFYRDQQGLEVDFVVETAGTLQLFEAKWSQKPDQKAIVPMQRLQDKIKSVSQKYVLCRTDSSYPLNDVSVVNGFTDQSWLELL